MESILGNETEWEAGGEGIVVAWVVAEMSGVGGVGLKKIIGTVGWVDRDNCPTEGEDARSARAGKEEDVMVDIEAERAGIDTHVALWIMSDILSWAKK